MLAFVFISRPAFSPEQVQTVGEPEPTAWSKADSKAYAKSRLVVWAEEIEWRCLTRLWGKESAWNPEAYNKIKVRGKNAGGIPQLLGLSPDSHPIYQIDKGLEYIYHRYKTPCQAWKFWKKKGWY